MAKKQPEPDVLATAVTRTKQLVFLGGFVVLVAGGVASAWEKLAGVRAAVIVVVALTVGLVAWAFVWLRRSYASAERALKVKHDEAVRNLDQAFEDVRVMLADPARAFLGLFRTAAPEQFGPDPSHVMQRNNGTARLYFNCVLVNRSPHRMLVSEIKFNWTALVVSDEHSEPGETVVEPHDQREITVKPSTRTSKFRYEATDKRKMIANVYVSKASAKVRLLDAATGAPLGESVTCSFQQSTMPLPVDCE